MKRVTLLIVGVIAASAVAVGPGGDHKNSPDTAEPVGTPSAPAANVDQFPAVDSLFVVTDQLHGVARPSKIADLPSLVSGIIAEVHVHEGQFVSMGDPLVTMDNRIPRARLLAATVEANLTGALKRAEVQLKMAESRLARISKVVGTGAGAGFEREAAEGDRDQAQAAVEQQRDILKAAEADRQLAEAQLEQFTISAPFNGLVTEIHVRFGAVDPSRPVVTVANLDTLEIEMHVPSSMFGSVRVGESIRLNASQPISRTLDASVVSTSPIINSASDTFRCLLHIKNSTVQLPAGFSVVLDQTEGNGSHSRTASRK